MERGKALETNVITCADLSAVASSPETTTELQQQSWSLHLPPAGWTAEYLMISNLGRELRPRTSQVLGSANASIDAALVPRGISLVHLMEIDLPDKC